MSVHRGFYRHWKGHIYYVHGVACMKHEGDRRVVIYTSVRTEEVEARVRIESGFDFLAFDFLGRVESEFEELVDPKTGKVCNNSYDCIPRFERIEDPERSKVGRE